MEKSLLLKAIGNSPKLRVLDFLIENSIFDYSKSEIADNISMSRTTLDGVIEEFIKLKFIVPTRQIGRATLYKLNAVNPVIKELIKFDNMLIKLFADSKTTNFGFAAFSKLDL